VSKVSPDGAWVGYQINYNNGQDTLFIKQTRGEKEYVSPGCTTLSFVGRNWATMHCSGNSVQLIDLLRGTEEKFPDGTRAILSADERFLLIFEKKVEALVIRDLVNKDSVVLQGIDDLSYNA